MIPRSMFAARRKDSKRRKRPDISEQLLRLARSGDREALDRLLSEMEPRIVRYIDAALDQRLREVCERRDVLQEVSVRICRALPTTSFVNVYAFYGWVENIVQSVITDLARRHLQSNRGKVRSRSLNETIGSDSQGHSKHFVDLLKISVSGAHTHATQGEAIRLLYRALEALPDDHKNVIQWCVLESRPRSDVAALMGRNPDAVRALLGRALEGLAKSLREMGYGSYMDESTSK